MAPAVPATDSLTAALALAGLAVAIRRLDGADSLSRAFRAALVLAAAFLATRVGFWLSGSEVMRAVNFVLGALVPLAALLLAEVLVRRHAPAPMKWGVGVGAVSLALLAPLWPSAGSMLLPAFQLLALLAAAGLVLLRDRSSLSLGENGLIDRVSLALPFILPFLLSDHDLGLTSEPLRLSGVAILLTAWIGLGLGRHGQRPRGTAVAVAATLGLATATAAVLAPHLSLDLAGGLRLWGTLASAMILAALLHDDAEAQDAGRRRAFLPAPDDGAAQYLDRLRARGLLDDVVLVDGKDLDDFDREALRRLLAARGPIPLDDLPPHGAASLAESQLRVLLERCEATQAHLLGSSPLRLALVRAAGPLGAGPDPDFQMAFALARTLLERPPAAMEGKTP